MAKIVQKPSSVRDLGAVDVSAILPVVSRVSDQTWQSEDATKENAYSCFHDTRHVIFRFIAGNLDPWEYYSNPAWTIWQPLLTPVMEQAIESYGFQSPVFPKVMLARLAAGARIDLHRDGAGSHVQTHKIHVPLLTNPQAILESAGHQAHLEVGRAYEVNNIALHGAENGGDTDRIHLIFEVFEGAQARPAVEAAG